MSGALRKVTVILHSCNISCLYGEDLPRVEDNGHFSVGHRGPRRLHRLCA